MDRLLPVCYGRALHTLTRTTHAATANTGPEEKFWISGRHFCLAADGSIKAVRLVAITFCSPDRSGDTCTKNLGLPIPSFCQATSPIPIPATECHATSGALHLVRCEVESVDFGFGQIVTPRHVTLVPRMRKTRRGFDQLLFPSP